MPNPSFPVVTLCVWSEPPLQSLVSQLEAQSATMAAQGKTDNLPEIDHKTPAFDVRRNWLDIASANEWITYLQGLGGPLESAIIETS